MYNETAEWVRIRNLRISISKGLIAYKWDSERSFSELELKDAFCFKSSDIAYNSKKFFNKKKGKYTLLDVEKAYINKILNSNKIAEPLLREADARFVAEFGGFYNEYVNNNYGDFPFGQYKKIERSMEEILPVLHWGHLPILNKYLLHNRNINPERRTVEFYHDFHCMKAMLDEIKGKGQIMQNYSDNTLEKELIFKVYNRRHNYSDRYRIRRTIDGWYCSFIAINGKCEKDGDGALFKNLNHDCVFSRKRV